MRLAAFAGLFFVFAITGCYKPHVQNGGFTCSMSDATPCPNGFYCVGGLCVDSPNGGSGGGGGSAGGGGGGGGSAGSAGGGGGGGGMASVDMSMPLDMMMSTPADMTNLPPDMACFPFGHTCGGDTTCCNECCHGCNAFGDCAAIG